MVTTRQSSPEKQPPTGRRGSRVGASRSDMRALRAERRAQAMQANPPVEEDARPASTPPPLFTQPPSSPPLAAVGGVHRSDDDVDDDDEDEECARMQSCVPGAKTTGEMEDDQPEVQTNNEDDDEGMTIKRLDVKSKSKMSDADLCKHFTTELQKKGASGDCGNCDCFCLAILSDGQVRSAVARYLSWFWRRPSKYERDMIIFEWYKYSSFVKKDGQGRLSYHNYRLPYMDDGTEPVPETVRNHLVCTKGLQTILGYGKKSFRRMSREAMCSSVLPLHKATGKLNYNAIENDQKKLEPLVRHFEILQNLGEVRATRVVSTFVDGTISNGNRDVDPDVTYLPISMGYRVCYRRYMASLGYEVETAATGALRIKKEDGSAIDIGEFVSYPTYYKKWKRDYPNLKVSRPVEDICNLCYTFAHRTKYFADVQRRCLHDNDEDDDEDEDVDKDDVDELTRLTGEFLDLNRPECAATLMEEQREKTMLEAAEHIQKARAQRKLYQDKVTAAKMSVDRPHSERTYTFVVDYGQNMSLPVFNAEQPGCTYYYSPMTVNNLGVVNHAHKYPDGTVGEHMHCHVYTDAVGKKGANNVASLIMKTLRHLDILKTDTVGCELNIIFDNCCGQNKNNTVLRLVAWLAQLGHFYDVNFIFLVVGHTKNAADRLFNSLKVQYRKKNLYTFDQLVEALSSSRTITVHPTVAEDFLDYGKLFDFFYKKLAGQIQQNHIFSSCQGDEIRVRESVLHQEIILRVFKKNMDSLSNTQVQEYAQGELAQLEFDGINPYKVYELFKHYRPYVPIEYQSDPMYAEPSPEQMAKVKSEKVDRKEFRATLKKKKYDNTKERLEAVAFGDLEQGEA